MIINKTSLIVLFVLMGQFIQASVPDVINFTTKEYKGHSINYDFEQDSTGLIYIANAYRVIEYDGKSFRKIALVAGKSAVSLAKDNKGCIYVGSSSEFGYLDKDSTQKTYYKSLKHLIPGNPEINEVFQTVWFDNAIYFACSKGIYRFKNHEIKPVKGFSDSTLIDDMSLVNGELLFWENAIGLGRVKGLNKEVFIKDEKTRAVRGIEFINNNYVIFGKFGVKTVRNSTLFNVAQHKLQNANISKVLKINNDEFLIGTVNEGIYLMDAKGNPVRHFTTKHGLQDNFIRNLFKDQAGNIWVAYNNGIGIFKWGSPLQYITNSQGFEGMGYSGIVYENTLYIGTSLGLYKMNDWENGLNKVDNFQKVEGIPSGTIMYLSIANGKLIICHAAETYTLQNGKAVRISDGAWYGSWIWKTADRYKKNEGFVGTYEGVERYLFQNNTWIHKTHIKGFKESSRVMEIDERGIIWAIQGNKGLYRVELNNQRDSAVSVINYSDKPGFKTDDFNDIFYLNNTIYITTFQGVYYLNGDSLIKDESFKNISKYVERARINGENNIYGIYKDQPYLLKKINEKWEIKPSSASFSRSNMVGSAEFFQRIAKNAYLIGTQEGFTLYKPQQEPAPSQTKCLIRNVEIIGEKSDSMLFYGKPKSVLELPYENNNLRFTFSIPDFGVMNQIIYQTKLLYGNKKLTNWQNVKEVNYREFTNLKEGDYSFIVRAKKGNSALGKQTYKFTVLPPWYRTVGANAFYFILIIMGGMFIRKRFKSQAKKLKAEKELELEIKEKLFKTERLETELKTKENELAYMALSYTQKKEMLASVESELDRLSKGLEHGERTKVNSLKRSISSSIDDESNWENFQIHFDQKNDNFFHKLNEVDNKLNESYLLFCSYVKMGKSNKEIAELLNLSLAAVEKRKYRLKKKWGLDNDTSFTDYLRSL